MAFQTALSGLNAAQGNLSVTGNNIANSSTTGFKRSRAIFADVYAASMLGSSSTAIGSGVRLASVAQEFTQGNVEFTESPLDLAINGPGFFRLDDNGSLMYSRAGVFNVDRDGYIVNSTGQKLTGYQADLAGNITGALGSLSIDTTNIQPSPTGSTYPAGGGGISATLNLDANAATITPPPAFDRTVPSTYHNATSLTIYDSLGNPLLATMYYIKRGANTWDTHLWLDYTDNAGTTTSVEVIPSGGVAGTPATLTFDTSGALVDTAPPGGAADKFVDYAPVSLVGITDAANLDFDVNYDGSTQYGSPFSVAALTQDGYTTGQISGIDIDSSGLIYARYTNGKSRALGQVALTNFANPQGLQPSGDTLWAETYQSGQPLVGSPGSSGLGLIQSGALESSNVDISKQLVNMIIAQRDFQANAKMISTEDQVTQAIINIR